MNITIFAAQYLSMYMFGGLQNLYVTYVHIKLEVTVTDIGDIFSNDFKIVAPTSSQNLQNIPPTCDQIIDEVFSYFSILGRRIIPQNGRRYASFGPISSISPGTS